MTETSLRIPDFQSGSINLLNARWGRTRLDPDQCLPDFIAPKSNKTFKFLCSCGRSFVRKFSKLRNTSTCGRCSFRPKKYWLDQSWGELKLNPNQDLPEEWGEQSNLSFSFLCSCGKTTLRPFDKLNSKAACGRCSIKVKEDWLKETWSDLRLFPDQELPKEWKPHTSKSFQFLCSCGRVKSIAFNAVVSGYSKSCGQCSFKSKDYWLNQRWNKIRLDPDQPLPAEWGEKSNKSFRFICQCGKSTSIPFSDSRKNKSCGKCDDKNSTYWIKQRWGKLRLKEDQPLPSSWGQGSEIKLWFLCDCGGCIQVRMYNMTNESTKSCGCMKMGENKFSAEADIRRFVADLSPDTLSHSYTMPENKKRYDVYVPSKKLAVEYHGLVWHSERFKSGKKDYEKLLLARGRGDYLVQIYEDEWRDKQAIIKNFLRNILQPEKGKRIKPKFEVFTETSQEARDFLDEHHYLGAASGCLTTVAKHKSEIVGVWVFMKREAGTVLWHRACWDHKYRTWNPHQKALEMAKPLLKQMGFRRILTFSDNRFHTGDLYEKLGFIFEKEISPNYYYTNGRLRKSKYALRVKSGVNEKVAARDKGWYRLWDSGKKRFSLLI